MVYKKRYNTESRIIQGVYTVKADDIAFCTPFEDSIALGGHCIDIHSAKTSEQDVSFLNQPYKIPYRCMITSSIDNLIIAGRSVSAEKVAQASMRVQATCMAEGEAAGCAAAICSQSGASVQDVDIQELQKRLSVSGALF